MRRGHVIVRAPYQCTAYRGQVGVIVRSFSRVIGVRRQKRWFHDVRFMDGQVRRFPDASLVVVSAGSRR